MAVILPYLIQIDNGLHFLGIAEAHLGYPESAAHVRPIAEVLGGLHRPAHIRTQNTVGLVRTAAKCARHTQPVALGYFGDAIACLVHAHITAVAEDHLVGVLGVGRVAYVAYDALVVLDTVTLEFVRGTL